MIRFLSRHKSEEYLNIKKPEKIPVFLLPDLDSNQDIQYQKLLYYPYTIGQSDCRNYPGCKNNRVATTNQMYWGKYFKYLEKGWDVIII